MFLEHTTSKDMFFPKEKFVFLCKTNSSLGKSKNNFSAGTIVPQKVCCFFVLVLSVFPFYFQFH